MQNPSQETYRLKTEKIDGIVADVEESNARYFKVIIDGPVEVRYQGHYSLLPALTQVSCVIMPL